MGRSRAVFHDVLALALAAVGFAVRPDNGTPAADCPRIDACLGAPTAVRPSGSIMLRMDGANTNEVVYVTQDGAGTWEAIPLDAGDDAFDDTANWYATDTIKSALAAIATAIGGTNSTTRNFTNGTGTLLADNDSVFTALNKLDQGFVALKAIINGAGASMVGLEDTAAWFTGTNLEVALAEIAVAIGGASSTVRNYSSNNYVADNDTLLVAIGKLDAQLGQASEHLLPMAVLGAWAVDGDGASTNGGGLVGATPTLTEAANAQCKVEDGGVFANLGAGPNAGYTSNWQIFPDTPVNNDAVYFGASTKFCEIAIDMGGVVQASGGAVFTWEYSTGAGWSALTIAQDNTNGAVKTGTRSFERDGAIHFVPPADWAQRAVDGVTVFWVRCRISNDVNIGANKGVTNAKNHHVVTPDGGYVARQTGTVTTLRLVDNAGTLHTTADVKFILMNYTTGEHSGELTFSQDKRAQRYTGLTLGVTAGDVLGVVVTQEDGAAEPAGVMFDLGLTIT